MKQAIILSIEKKNQEMVRRKTEKERHTFDLHEPVCTAGFASITPEIEFQTKNPRAPEIFVCLILFLFLITPEFFFYYLSIFIFMNLL